MGMELQKYIRRDTISPWRFPFW